MNDTKPSVAETARALLGLDVPVDEESFRKAHEVCVAPVYGPDDPRGFSFVREDEEERPDARVTAPTRVRPRGPRKPAGRVWGVLLFLTLPALFGCSSEPSKPTTPNDLIAIGLMFGFVLLLNLIEAWRDKK